MPATEHLHETSPSQKSDQNPLCACTCAPADLTSLAIDHVNAGPTHERPILFLGMSTEPHNRRKALVRCFSGARQQGTCQRAARWSVL